MYYSALHLINNFSIAMAAVPRKDKLAWKYLYHRPVDVGRCMVSWNIFFQVILLVQSLQTSREYMYRKLHTIWACLQRQGQQMEPTFIRAHGVAGSARGQASLEKKKKNNSRYRIGFLCNGQVYCRAVPKLIVTHWTCHLSRISPTDNRRWSYYPHPEVVMITLLGICWTFYLHLFTNVPVGNMLDILPELVHLSVRGPIHQNLVFVPIWTRALFVCFRQLV